MNEIFGAIMLVAGGLFAGGSATFAWSRVPIWRRMPVPAFVADFDATIRWTDKVQPALLVVAALSAVAFAATADGSARVVAAIGAGGFFLVLVGSLAVLVPLQRRIVAMPVTRAADIEGMRLRWFSGNLGRSMLAVGSFTLMAAATMM